MQVVPVLVAFAHVAIFCGLGLRVVWRRRPVGVTIAWLGVIVLAPFLGAACYFLFGESRLGNKTERRMKELLPAYRAWLATPREAKADWAGLPPEPKEIHELGVRTVGIPALCGNRLVLHGDSIEAFRSIVADIDAARESVHMEFYIWEPGGAADEVAAALLRAAKRGVSCRVLLDSIGSADFLGSHVAREFRESSVRLVEALPVSLARSFVVRADHRTHRKIIVIDCAIGYTGSLNIVDPREFKLSAGVGHWIDAMVRVEGPAVEGLAIAFLGDWELATDEGLEEMGRTVRMPPRVGGANVQVVPSGPGFAQEAIHKLILTAIYAARKELVLTTPYFVPSDALLIALVSAAERGVDVTIVLPARNDSWLVHYASHATFEDLLAAGVKLFAFEKGLLHTKSITVDGHTSVFGSVNLDMRSFYLNFEISLFVYDRAFTGNLRELQRGYVDGARRIDAAEWSRRPLKVRLVENVVRLAGPLL
ncbi:MAG: cardiolipin synthase [Planctomycetota bacterium]